MSEPDDYPALLKRLVGLEADAAALRDEARRWHTERSAAADEVERAAEDAVRRAEGDLRAAQRREEEVHARAAELWATFVHRVGPRAERFGRALPEPVVPRQRGDRGPDAYLGEVASRLSYAEPPVPLTNATRALFALLGAVGGGLGFVAGELLRSAGRRAGGDWAVGLPVLALLLTLLGPVAAAAAAKRVADHRRVALDAVAVAVVAGAGLGAVAVLTALFG